jgi:predicted RNase H-like HicB family nuclease
MAAGSSPLSFTVLLVESTDGGYVAFVKEYPGCAAQGETAKEAEDNLRDVLETFLEDLWECRFPSRGAWEPPGKVLKEETYHLKPERCSV